MGPEKGAGPADRPLLQPYSVSLSRQPASAGLVVALDLRRNAAAAARPAKPSPIITQVDGSGTAPGITPG